MALVKSNNSTNRFTKVDATRELLVEYYANPKSLRPSVEKLAKKLGVSRQAIHKRIKNDSDFQIDVAKRIKDKVKDDRADVYKSLADKAKQGNIPAIKLWLQLAGDLSEKNTLSIETPLSFRWMSDEEGCDSNVV